MLWIKLSKSKLLKILSLLKVFSKRYKIDFGEKYSTTLVMR